MKLNVRYSITLLISLAAILYYLAAIVKPVLIFHTQQIPFLNSFEFFKGFLDRPGDLIQYLAQLLAQGFYTNIVGSLVIISVLLINAMLTVMLIKRAFGVINLFWPFLLVLFSLTFIQNYYFPFVVLVQETVVLLALILIAKNVYRKKGAWLSLLVFYLLLYYAAGSGPALVFLLGSIILFMFNAPVRKYYLMLIILIFGAVNPFAAYKVLFNVAPLDAYLNFFPDLTISVKYVPGVWFYLGVFLVPITLLILGLFHSLNEGLISKLSGHLKSNAAFFVILFVFTIGSYFFLRSTQDITMQKAVHCDYYNSIGEFDQTINLAMDSRDEYNIAINLSFIRAIANKGELSMRLLDYPQLLGSQIMQPDKLGSPVYMMSASDFYYDLGYISEAQHFAYGELAINPGNLRAKRRLVETNILLENFAAAQVYLNSISQSFHLEEFIEQQQDLINEPSLIDIDPVLTEKRKLMPDNFAIPVAMTERMKDLVTWDSTNILAYEFLQSCYLMDHNLSGFMANLDASLKFYNQIPRIYEQAIMMYFFNTEQPGLENYSISRESKEMFNNFIGILASTGNDMEAAKGLLGSYSNTYMYYVMYLSPKVTNVKVIQQAY